MSLREQVIQRVYDECADFAERNGISEEEACVIAAKIGNMLPFIDSEIKGMRPYGFRFVASSAGDVFLHFSRHKPARLIEYVHDR